MRAGRKNRRERGAALVAALCLIVTAGVLVGSLVSISRMSALNANGMTEWMRSQYVAEGAAARIRFLIESDRYQFTPRRPEDVDFEEYEHDRYLADGSEHVLDYYGREIRFTITDGVSGLPFQNGSALNTLSQNRTDETLVTDAVELYRDRISDYMDSDDTANEDSMEEEEYENLNMKNMPRNAAPQYREELLWIPGFRRRSLLRLFAGWFRSGLFRLRIHVVLCQILLRFFTVRFVVRLFLLRIPFIRCRSLLRLFTGGFISRQLCVRILVVHCWSLHRFFAGWFLSGLIRSRYAGCFFRRLFGLGRFDDPYRSCNSRRINAALILGQSGQIGSGKKPHESNEESHDSPPCSGAPESTLPIHETLPLYD